MTAVPNSSIPPAAAEDAIDRNRKILACRTKSGLVDIVLGCFNANPVVRPLVHDEDQLSSLIWEVSRQYFDNPYHNFRHAVDTTNAIAWLLTRPRLGRWVPPLHQFTLLIAALTHDLGHPGTDNQWEMKTGSDLARRYDNRSVLEKQSLDRTLELIEQPKLAVFAWFSEQERKEARQVLSESILSTDFSIHGAFLERLRRFLEQGNHTFETYDERIVLDCALIKAADIANTAKEFAVARLWGRRVMREYWAQGDREKACNLDVGPLNDRDLVNFPRAQSEFIEHQALPLFRLLAELDPATAGTLDELEANRRSYLAYPRRNH